MESIIVGIAEGKTACFHQELVSYALGSCVGVCLYDPVKKIAGMAHVVLPHKGLNRPDENRYKYADEGVRALLEELVSKGAVRGRILAKIAGGAKMFETANRVWEIGENNVAAVKEALQEEKIPLLAEDTGKNYGRTIRFRAIDGKLEISTVRHIPIII